MRIYQRNGTWWVDRRIRGKRVRTSTGETERSRALEKLSDGLHAPRSGETVSAALDRYLEDSARRGLRRPGERRQRVERLRRDLGAMVLSALDLGELERWADGLIRGGLSGATVRVYLAELSAAWALATRHGAPPRPPFPRLEPAQPKGRLIDEPTFRRIQEFLPLDIARLAETAYLTGRRLGELLALEAGDIEAGTIRFRRTKNGRDMMLPITERLARLLALPAPTLSRKPASGNVESPAFSRGGRPLSRSAVNRAWRRAAEQAGVPWARFHDLRHSAVTRMISAGLGRDQARAVSGHRSDQVFSWYVHLDAEQKRTALAALERGLA